MPIKKTRRSPVTPDRLVCLQRAIRRTKPWQWATGPRTQAGKARSKMNALKHGLRSAEVVARRKELAELIREVRAINEMERMGERLD